MEVVNAYLSGMDVVLLRRDGGVLKRGTATPEYVVYLRADEVGRADPDLVRQISGSPIVRSFKREQEGEWLRVGFCDDLIRHEMLHGKKKDGKWIESPFKSRDIRTFEGDVDPVRRLLTDRGAVIQKPLRAYFDLETDSRVPFSKKEEMRILSWAVSSEDGRKWSAVLEEDSNTAEEALLARFWETVAEFDQLLAWNGDNFDFPVIEARTDRTNLRVDVKRWLWLDHLALFKRMNMHSAESGDEKQSMRLNSIAMAVLGEGKHDFDASKTWEAWAAGGKSREDLVRYNVQDTDLLPKIEAKTGFAALYDTLADACRVFPNSAGLHPTKQMDGFMLRVGLERGIHFPTKRYREESEQFKGAFVMEPKTNGVARDVHVCDFSALYPSIILTFNMSPETRCDVPVNGSIPEGMCRSPSTRQGFRVDVEGILPHALKELIRLRKHWNEVKASLPPGTPEWHEADRRSTAYKVAANSFYGVVGSPFSRFFDKRIAESVTQTGVWLIKLVIEHAERLGMRVVYGDTDSCFVQDATRTQFEEFVRWCNVDLFPKEIAAQGCAENHVKLAYEKQFARVVFVSAKRYAAMYSHYKGAEASKDSKPEVKGLEFKRGDAALLGRRLQERIIHSLIVEGDERIDTYREIVDQQLQHVLNDTLPLEEVELTKAVTKPLKEYVAKKKKDDTDGALPVHVRVAKLLADRGREVGEGTRIGYVVVDGDGGINEAIPSEDYAGGFDRYYLWESLVYPPSQRFLQAAFPDADWKTGYEKVRPPKPRGRASKAPEGQLGLLDVRPPETPVPVPNPPTGPRGPVEDGGPFVLDVDGRIGPPGFEAIMDVVRSHPGDRPLTVRLHLEGGAVAILASQQRVDPGPSFQAALEHALWAAAASTEWEITCAS